MICPIPSVCSGRGSETNRPGQRRRGGRWSGWSRPPGEEADWVRHRLRAPRVVNTPGAARATVRTQCASLPPSLPPLPCTIACASPSAGPCEASGPCSPSSFHPFSRGAPACFVPDVLFPNLPGLFQRKLFLAPHQPFSPRGPFVADLRVFILFAYLRISLTEVLEGKDQGSVIARFWPLVAKKQTNKKNDWLSQ